MVPMGAAGRPVTIPVSGPGGLIMAHTHDHGHDHGTHYIDQLCSVAVAGALGVIAVVLYLQGALNILAAFFQQALLGGGILLVILAIVRGATLWFEVGRQKPAHHHHHHHHDHDHAHGHDCGHDHEHGPSCDHDHHAEETPAGVSLPVVASQSEPAHDHGH